MPLTRAMAAGKTAVPSNSRSGQSNETSDEAHVEGQPPHKRARVAATRAPKRPKKASLSRLLDMPPEVFNEIATHLLPADLLSLARSAKLFRNIFMSRTSEHLWKQSLANNPSIPDCPPQLSEPYYVSLLFSKTCSQCGTKVFRRMDPYLYVRLCTPCRDTQIVEISLLDSVAPTLPVSDVIKEPRFGYGYTLRSELAQLAALAGQAVEDKNREWREERTAEIEERREHSEILEEYLDMVEEERELEIDNLKAQRREQIETRLLESGWTKQSIKPSPDTSAEWNKLVSQPKPLTDRIWNNLYPKLVPLLNSNRSYNIELDKKNRRRDCIRKLQALVSSIRMSLPPLVRLVRKTPLTDDETPAPATLSSSATSNSDIKVEQPFPSINELLTWPIIKSIVDDDISPEQVETRFGEIRDEFDQAVLEWRDKIERDLVAVWNAGREEETAVESTSKGKGKGKAVARTTKTRARKTRTSAGSSSSASTSAVELALPEFVATYTKPDGTSTTLLSDLSPNLQLLLRADTVFGPAYSHDYVLNRTYPAIVPRAVPLGLILGGSDELNYGDRWDPDRVKRDDEMSAVAKKMLARVGRPDATSVEMKALGTNFKCGRCNRTLTNSWEDLVVHYSVEEKRHRQAQEKIRDEPGRGFVFHTTHGLDSPNPRPFAHLMTPQESAEYVFQATIQQSPMTTCMKCQAMGIEARYFHTFAPGFESPIIEHLRDVHDVMVAQPIIDFQGWYGAPHFFDSDSEEDSGSEEEWEILDFH